MLEPIRGIFTTPPGEVKVVWFRPDDDGRHLKMHEQLGHTEEGQRELKLTIGASMAGKAFARELEENRISPDEYAKRVRREVEEAVRESPPPHRRDGEKSTERSKE